MWQTAVARAVIEMDAYTVDDLTGGADNGEGHEGVSRDNIQGNDDEVPEE